MPTLPTWTDLNPVIDEWSGKKNILIPYYTLIPAALLRKLIRNTSYNYGNCQEVILAQELIPRLTEKSYDTDKDWSNAYVQFLFVRSYNNVLNFPMDLSTGGGGTREMFNLFVQFTSEYQNWLGLRYKYIATGGFKLYNGISNADARISGAIIKMRGLTAIEVTP